MIDFLRREVEVRRQVKWLSGRGLVFASPKRGKARTVPLPELVAVALAAHIRRFPPVEVTLTCTGKGGGEVTADRGRAVIDAALGEGRDRLESAGP